MYITTNSHTLYIYIFHYYLMPAPDYTVIISFPLFAPYFFHDCTVIIPFLLFAPYSGADYTVIIYLSSLYTVFLSGVPSNISKIGFAYSTPLPLNHEGLGVFLCYVFLHNSLMNILQKIFTDHYEEIKYTLHPRKTEMENIDKMLNCGDPSFGGAMYGCPHCGKLKFVPFRCRSRFCPTCDIVKIS